MDRIGVTCVVVILQQVLLLRRALHDVFLPGRHELPGGGLEPGESILDGMHRELSEEIGIQDLHHVEPLLRYDATYGDTLVRHIAFLVLHRSMDVRVNPDEHMSHIWCPLYAAAALAQYDIGEDAEPWILEEARRRLRK